ncbi:hypothetical protein HC891_26200 [Candidatus Gracilibacteria bacterium]|nr:hypothetical protein [Candidatus Gracilibacteria bacterium]
MQTDFNQEALTQAIAENLPVAIKPSAGQIANALRAAVQLPDQPITINGDASGAVVALGGKAIAVDQRLISFGHGTQFGDVTIGSTMAGTITNIQFTLPNPPESLPIDRPADLFAVYLIGMRRLLDLLGIQHPRYVEALTYQVRLAENVDRAQRFGDTENMRAERAAVLDALNRLALAAVQRSFNAIVGLGCPATAWHRYDVNQTMAEAHHNSQGKWPWFDYWLWNTRAWSGCSAEGSFSACGLVLCRRRSVSVGPGNYLCGYPCNWETNLGGPRGTRLSLNQQRHNCDCVLWHVHLHRFTRSATAG